MRSDCAEDEPPDVCQIRHAASLHLRDSTRMDKLGQKPKADQKGSWNECDSHENEDEQNGLNLIAGIRDHESAHDRRDRTAGAQVWNSRMRSRSNLSQHGNQATSE